MDYLNDGDPASGKSLGIEGIWLTPIFSSRSYHKYDVMDYYEVDPAFGTEEDLKDLISICHERGVYLILDLPINHTGRGNKWYSAFASAHQQMNTQDPYYDFYSWYDPAVQECPAGRDFAQIIGSEHYYECNFSGDMPEINFDSDFAREKVLEVAKYYLDLGVDGFRFDAAKYIYFGDNVKSTQFWDWYMGKLREIKPDVYVIAEVWDGDGITDMYFPYMNCFDFSTAMPDGLIAQTANKGDVNAYTAYVSDYIERVTALRSGAQITPFVANHDTDRAAGFLTVASGNMQMAANLYILGPGTPYIYYGEELGMRGSRGGANTDANRRLAMLWGDGDPIQDPTGTSYPSSRQIETTVVDQKKDENSLYTYYKRLIMLRSAYPQIARGEYKPLKLSGTKVGGFISTLDGSSVVVIHNTTGSSQTVDLSSIAGVSATELAAVIGMEDASLDGNILTIGSLTSVILK